MVPNDSQIASMSPEIRVEVETTAGNRRRQPPTQTLHYRKDVQLGGNGTDYTFYERQWTEDDGPDTTCYVAVLGLCGGCWAARVVAAVQGLLGVGEYSDCAWA
ncbi:hypothetical protein B0A48_15646 [Cryoendolithus antarcticus]|uniref:Uncharacterized protein n=1 Tax=Cryoendolithus antarcticus TaxID=1507870 RepID=A0A1V8SGV0_9PEZI|nr:hypothetical protein B0A48_15646 [Cryoendolithus antarcticus]